jgi:hypothetical protein
MPKNLDLKFGINPIYKLPTPQPQMLHAYELVTTINKIATMKYFFMLKFRRMIN